jgi:nickel transport protein
MLALRFLALALVALLLCKPPAAAFDLFATHEVSVQFVTQDGKPMADADVRVFAPGDLRHPVKTGHTDKDGGFQFGTDRDGLWTVEARNGTEVARATVKVGGGLSDDQGETSPYVIIGLLGVLLVVAVGFRFLRARSRTPRR